MPGLPHSVPHDPCGLLPITGPSPRILILGSYPSVLSLEREEYYGNPKNRFWEVMEEIFSVPASLPYRDRTALLSKRGVAIWDIVASCERKGSADSQIKKPVPNDVSGFFRKHPTLRLVALNGGMAGRLYHQFVNVPGLRSVVLPSTSPAHAAMPFEMKVLRWREGLTINARS